MDARAANAPAKSATNNRPQLKKGITPRERRLVVEREGGPLPTTALVTGALCRKTDPKIATAPKTQSRSVDQNKDKDNPK